MVVDPTDLDARYLLLSGGTMAGDIAMGSNSVTGLAEPTNDQDAASKNYIGYLFTLINQILVKDNYYAKATSHRPTFERDDGLEIVSDTTVDRALRVYSTAALPTDCIIEFQLKATNNYSGGYKEFGLTTQMRNSTTEINGIADFIGFFGDAGNWHAKNINSGGNTVTDTGIALDTSYHTFKIDRQGAQILFYIDGNLEATHNTNLPTSAMNMFASVYTPSGVPTDVPTINIVYARVIAD